MTQRIKQFPEPPSHLDDIATKHWRSLMPRLAKHFTPDRLDYGNLESLCVAYEMAAKAYRDVVADGYTIDEISQSSCKKVKHPLLDTVAKYQTIYANLGKAFGLDPLSRQKLGFEGEQKKEADPMESLLN